VFCGIRGPSIKRVLQALRENIEDSARSVRSVVSSKAMCPWSRAPGARKHLFRVIQRLLQR